MHTNKATKKLKIALPKGTLQSDTLALFTKAGYTIGGYNTENRNYRPTIHDQEMALKVLRPQEIPLFVSDTAYDLGIAGIDWVLENGIQQRDQTQQIEEILDLEYGPVQLVLAVPEDWSDVDSFGDLMEFHWGNVRIATEYLNLASKYVLERTDSEPSIRSPWSQRYRQHTSRVELLHSFGASEGKPPEDSEAIIDIASPKATTIKENGLKIVDVILTSTARLLASSKALADPWKAVKINEVKENLAKAISSH